MGRSEGSFKATELKIIVVSLSFKQMLFVPCPRAVKPAETFVITEKKHSDEPLALQFP